MVEALGLGLSILPKTFASKNFFLKIAWFAPRHASHNFTASCRAAALPTLPPPKPLAEGKVATESETVRPMAVTGNQAVKANPRS